MDRLKPWLLRLGVRTTFEAEWGWVAGRFGVVAAAGVAVPLFLRGTSAYPVALGLLGFAVIYNSILLLLLIRQRVQLVFAIGLVLDNVALLIGWWSATSASAGEQQTDDLWLILIPLVIVGVLRMGWMIGAVYMVLWLAFMSWSFVHYYGPDSYDVQQLPVRIGFTIVIVGLVMRLMTLVAGQRDAELERRGAIEQMEELKSTLLKAVAHDVRSPMTAVKTAAEMLTDETIELTPEQRKRLGTALRRGLVRLGRTVEDSLSYAELKAGGADRTFYDVDLSAVVENAVAITRDVAEQQGRRMELVGPDNAFMTHGDRAWLLQMLTNILGYATENAPPGTAVAVRMHALRAAVVVEVAYRGPSIPKAEQHAIFEEYYRGRDPDRRPALNSGLGLASAKRIAEEHGGTISVDSPDGGPTTFTVKLPLLPSR